MFQAPLEVVADHEGFVALGWLAEGVFYARFMGGLSAELGSACARRIERAVLHAPALTLFADSSALKHYDLLARGAFARAVQTSRRQFSSIVLLSWEGISPNATSFASAIGGAVQVLTNHREFEARMLRVAPHAKPKIDPKNWAEAATTLGPAGLA